MILNILGFILLLTGFILVMRGMWLRKPNHPSLESHDFKTGLRLTFQPWKYKDYWDKTGYKYDFVGRLLFLLGMACLVIRWTL